MRPRRTVDRQIGRNGEKEQVQAVGTRGSPSKKISTSNKTAATPISSHPSPASHKRKRNDSDASQESASSPSKKPKKGVEEKRLKRYRANPPQTFMQKLERAQNQRMIVIGRSRHGQGADLHEDIDIVGTTGNIYTVSVGLVPSCTCPDHQKGNECKHKVYALHTVLRAPFELQYQRAFLSSELADILANAPPIPDATSDSEEDNGGKRKPIEGECPICYMDFDPDNNELVWCKAACGNNMHKDCFDQWAASQRGKEVRCVYCRQPWQQDTGDVEVIKKSGTESGDGYINVAEQFGIERARDYSSYHQPWVRRTFGYGW